MASEEEKDENARQKILKQTRDQYSRLYRVIQIKKGDSILIILGKLILALIGVALTRKMKTFFALRAEAHSNP